MISGIFITLIKYVVLSALLLSIYMLLLKGRVSYLTQRIFMLSIPVVAFVATLVSVDLIRVDEYEVVSQVVEVIGSDDVVVEPTRVVVMDDQGVSSISDQYREGFYLDPMLIVMAFWLMIAIYLLSRYVGGVLYIRHLRRLSTSDNRSGLWLYRCVLVNTPFSYFKAIYIDNQLSGEKFDIVVRHESAHISSLHYIDKLLIELYIIVSWFNPVIWRLRRELCAVHEFEADRVVLKGYSDINKYRKFLFDEVDLSSPRVANGFNSSLIKQRFLEMKKSYQNQNSGLRKVLALLSVAVLVSLTSLTYVSGSESTATVEAEDVEIVGVHTESQESSVTVLIDAVMRELTTGENGEFSVEKFANDGYSAMVIYKKSGAVKMIPGAEIGRQKLDITHDEIESISLLKGKPIEPIEEDRISVTMKSGEVRVFSGGEIKEFDMSSINPDDISSISVRKAEAAKIVMPTDRESYLDNVKIDAHLDVVDPELAFEAEKKKNNHDYYNYYFLNEDQYDIIAYDSKKPRIVVYRRDGYTEVDYIYHMGWDWHWIHFSSNSYLVDPKSGDRYQVHSLKGGIPLDRTSVVRGQKGKYVVITAIYPPLKKGVVQVDRISWTTPGTRVPSNGSSQDETGLKVLTTTNKSYGERDPHKVITLDPNFRLE